MPKSILPPEGEPSKVYPDPFGQAKGTVVVDYLSDIAAVGTIPAARTFTDLPTHVLRDIDKDKREERARARQDTP